MVSSTENSVTTSTASTNTRSDTNGTTDGTSTYISKFTPIYQFLARRFGRLLFPNSFTPETFLWKDAAGEVEVEDEDEEEEPDSTYASGDNLESSCCGNTSISATTVVPGPPPRTTPSPYLPTEILLDIFRRVPTEDHLNLRLVSPMWASTIAYLHPEQFRRADIFVSPPDFCGPPPGSQLLSLGSHKYLYTEDMLHLMGTTFIAAPEEREACRAPGCGREADVLRTLTIPLLTRNCGLEWGDQNISIEDNPDQFKDAPSVYTNFAEIIRGAPLLKSLSLRREGPEITTWVTIDDTIFAARQFQTFLNTIATIPESNRPIELILEGVPIQMFCEIGGVVDADVKAWIVGGEEKINPEFDDEIRLNYSRLLHSMSKLKVSMSYEKNGFKYTGAANDWQQKHRAVCYSNFWDLLFPSNNKNALPDEPPQKLESLVLLADRGWQPETIEMAPENPRLYTQACDIPDLAIPERFAVKNLRQLDNVDFSSVQLHNIIPQLSVMPPLKSLDLQDFVVEPETLVGLIASMGFTLKELRLKNILLGRKRGPTAPSSARNVPYAPLRRYDWVRDVFSPLLTMRNQINSAGSEPSSRFLELVSCKLSGIGVVLEDIFKFNGQIPSEKQAASAFENIEWRKGWNWTRKWCLKKNPLLYASLDKKDIGGAPPGHVGCWEWDDGDKGWKMVYAIGPERESFAVHASPIERKQEEDRDYWHLPGRTVGFSCLCEAAHYFSYIMRGEAVGNFNTTFIHLALALHHD